MKIWMVRDLLDGELSDIVGMWSTRPKLKTLKSGTKRWAGNVDDQGKLIGFIRWLHVQDAGRIHGTTPDNETQVIVIRQRSEEDQERVRKLLR